MTAPPCDWIGWRKTRRDSDGHRLGAANSVVKDQIFDKALKAQLEKGISQEEATLEAEREVAQQLFGSSKSHYGWEACEQTRSANKTECYTRCMALEMTSHEGEWDWLILPVGMRPEAQPQSYQTRRMLARRGM